MWMWDFLRDFLPTLNDVKVSKQVPVKHFLQVLLTDMKKSIHFKIYLHFKI